MYGSRMAARKYVIYEHLLHTYILKPRNMEYVAVFGMRKNVQNRAGIDVLACLLQW